MVSFLGDGPIEKKIVPKPVNEQPDEISCKIFPNPFNNTVSFNLCSPTAEITEIAIYDLQGRTFKAFRPTPGNYYFDTIWNGTDNQGQPLESGIYFLIVRNRKETLFRQKIVYLK